MKEKLAEVRDFRIRRRAIIWRDLSYHSQNTRICTINESLQINVGNIELKEVVHFKYLDGELTRDG